jgi:WD40 repeat protein
VFSNGDQTLRVWDVETGRELRTLKGHTDAVNGVAVSGNGTRVVSASWDNTVRVWDVETGESIATFTCDGAAYCCALAHDSRIAVGAEGGRVYFLDLLEPI